MLDKPLQFSKAASSIVVTLLGIVIVVSPDRLLNAEGITISSGAFANAGIGEITFTEKCKTVSIANDAFRYAVVKKINLPDFVYELPNVQAALKKIE